MKMQTDSERLTLAADDAATAAYYAYVTAVESLTNAHATRKAYDSAVRAVCRADRMLKKANAAKLKFDNAGNSVILSAQ